MTDEETAKWKQLFIIETLIATGIEAGIVSMQEGGEIISERVCSQCPMRHYKGDTCPTSIQWEKAATTTVIQAKFMMKGDRA